MSKRLKYHSTGLRFYHVSANEGTYAYGLISGMLSWLLDVLFGQLAPIDQ